MEQRTLIGTVVRRFTNLGCVAIKLVDGTALETGKTISFWGTNSEIHRQRVDSIQINHVPQERVTSSDPVAAVKLNFFGNDIPKLGAQVFLIPSN